MNVGEAAEFSGFSAKTIRYYEDIGLIAPTRAQNGYRNYSDQDLHRLLFLKRARNLGFTIGDCRHLMALYDDRARASQDVRRIASAHVAVIDEKLHELQSMRATLQRLIAACHGDDRPDCPILDDIAGDKLHAA
jgi:MerR family transcriptional regulator, copper efflux regulator